MDSIIYKAGPVTGYSWHNDYHQSSAVSKLPDKVPDSDEVSNIPDSLPDLNDRSKQTGSLVNPNDPAVSNIPDDDEVPTISSTPSTVV